MTLTEQVEGLEALNAALVLGAKLRELPIGAVLVLRKRSSVSGKAYQGEVTRQINKPGLRGGPFWHVAVILGRRAGGSRTVSAISGDIQEVVSLPSDWEGDPLDLIRVAP